MYRLSSLAAAFSVLSSPIHKTGSGGAAPRVQTKKAGRAKARRKVQKQSRRKNRKR